VEEARAGAHVRAVRGEGRREEEERRWVRETREMKASPQRAHKRCNQPGRKETGKLAFLGGLVLGSLKFVRVRLLSWASVANRRSCSPRGQPGPRATSANAPFNSSA
jgi:hypothetical protein